MIKIRNFGKKAKATNSSRFNQFSKRNERPEKKYKNSQTKTQSYL
jgi:hypothetical protein